MDAQKPVSGYLLDLDGTLVSGRTVLPDARWLLEAAGERFMLVSNNSEHTPRQLSRLLGHLGLDIPAERMVLAGTTALEIIAEERPGCRLQLIGSDSLRRYARQLGLQIDHAETEVVLVARDRRFSYARLASAARALSHGAELYVACPDHSHPGSDGQPVPEAGALAAAVIAASGVRRYRTIGKPEPAVFEIACRRLGIAARTAIMIGDSPCTDGEGAARLGMRYLRAGTDDLRRLLPQFGAAASVGSGDMA